MSAAKPLRDISRDPGNIVLVPEEFVEDVRVEAGDAET